MSGGTGGTGTTAYFLDMAISIPKYAILGLVASTLLTAISYHQIAMENDRFKRGAKDFIPSVVQSYDFNRNNVFEANEIQAMLKDFSLRKKEGFSLENSLTK